MEYLKLGTIIDTQGLDGTLKIYSTTSNGEMRYKKGSKVFLYDEDNNQRLEVKVVSYRHNGLFDFVKFEEINNSGDGKNYKGFEVQVAKNRGDLKIGYYFYSDLIGCKVYDQNKNQIGVVSNVEEFPAQLTLRVKKMTKGDFFVPFVKEFIKDVNVEEKVITINVIDGML